MDKLFTKRIGDYEILNEIGSGSLATVYKGRRGEKLFALKIIDLKFKSENDICASLQETRILSSIENTSIVKLHETFVDNEMKKYV